MNTNIFRRPRYCEQIFNISKPAPQKINTILSLDNVFYQKNYRIVFISFVRNKNTGITLVIFQCNPFEFQGFVLRIIFKLT